MRGLFVCNVSFSDAAKIGDVPLCRFAIDAHILDETCTPIYVTALAPACILVEFSRLPSNIHCEGPYIGVVQSAGVASGDDAELLDLSLPRNLKSILWVGGLRAIADKNLSGMEMESR